jgi:hypothetical protein
MRSRKAVIMTIILLGISIYLTVYTLKAHTLAASHIYETSEDVYWTSGPPGSLFPWPKEPGVLEYLSKVEGVDLIVYLYLIKTWLLVGLSGLSWLFTGLYVYVAHNKGYL